MSDAIIEPPKDSPRWARRIILALSVPTAILLAFVGLFVAMQRFGEQAHGVCETVGGCASPAPANLQLPDFASDWLDGGTNGNAVCEPVRQAYEKQNPGYAVKMAVLNSAEEHRVISQAVFDLKHDQYKYHCKFWGEPIPQ
jgi:hypothetical protein